MPSASVLVVCVNPSCPGRSVQESAESGYEVLREEWDATWHEPIRAANGESMPGEWDADIHCPRCSEEGIDPESGQPDRAEEELGQGQRCSFCGVVNPLEREKHQALRRVPVCEYCNEPLALPNEDPA